MEIYGMHFSKYIARKAISKETPREEEVEQHIEEHIEECTLNSIYQSG
jgi:hypothetical protein